MVTATNPLLSNRTVSLLWKCRNSLLRNRHCHLTMEMQQTHYYTTVTHVTMEMPSRPNISQYFNCNKHVNHISYCNYYDYEDEYFPSVGISLLILSSYY
jgi:superoxide dismutase